MECVIRDCIIDDGGDYSRLCPHHWCEQHDLSCDCSSCESTLTEEEEGELIRIFGLPLEYSDWVKKQPSVRSYEDD